MTSKGTARIFVLGVLSVLLFACSTAQSTYPPPTNPFLSGAPALDKTMLTQPTKVVLIWLEAQGTTAPPESAQRALAEKIKQKFSVGKSLEVVGVTTIPAPAGDPLPELRRAGAPFQVRQALVVMPNAAEMSSPVWLKYGQDGSGPGTRTDSYISISLVAIDLDTGKRLFSVMSNGEARLWKMDYEDARPFFPRISPGAYSSAFIYPERNAFPPGEVRAVALEDAVNGLIYKLDLATGS
jgi:hypothetical protein